MHFIAAEKTEPYIFRWKPCHHSREKRVLTDFLGFKLKLMFSRKQSDPRQAQFDSITLWGCETQQFSTCSTNMLFPDFCTEIILSFSRLISPLWRWAANNLFRRSSSLIFLYTHLFLFQVENPSMPNDEGITPLHNAVCAGHHHIVKFLLDFGVNVNAADSDGWSVPSFGLCIMQ